MLHTTHSARGLTKPILGGRLMFMRYEIEESKDHPGAYLAFAVNHEGDGEIYIAEFVGPKARQLAEEYAEWKNGERHSAAA
jgi:hypothetical protein